MQPCFPSSQIIHFSGSYSLTYNPFSLSIVSWSSTVDEDVISPDEDESGIQDKEDTPEPEMKQGDSSSQGTDNISDMETEHGDSIGPDKDNTPEAEVDQSDTSSQGTDTTSGLETDVGGSIGPDKETTPEAEMSQGDSNSPDKDSAPEPEMNQDYETSTSSF